MKVSVKNLPEIFDRPSTLAELKALCKQLGINNSVEYRNRYRDIPGLVAHPERVYSEEWVSYCDLFDIPEFFTYEDLNPSLTRPSAKRSAAKDCQIINH
jgi:hypothetical protein